MAKGAIITEDVKKLIAQVFLENPGWRAKEIQAEVSHRVSKNGDNWPSLSVVEKLLVDIRKRYTENTLESDSDKPWHLHEALDLPAEAIAAIFEVQKWLEHAKDNEMLSTIPGWTDSITGGRMATTIWPLTIRDALWISRLYKVKYSLWSTEQLYLKLHKKPVVTGRILIENPYRLWYAAKTYADYQRLCELAGINFDTSKLDEAIRNDSLGETKYNLFLEQKLIKEGENERSHNTTE